VVAVALKIFRRNLKLTVAYDGSGYHGFQRQPNVQTIQQVLEERLSELLQAPITINGAARTDAGVHAYGQVFNFYTNNAIPVERLPVATRGVLPLDIVVLTAQEMPPDFHARFSARGKIYRYLVLNSSQPDPLLRKYAWQIYRPLDAEKIDKALQELVGEHHFGAFQASGSSARNPVRTLFSVRCTRTGDKLEFELHGNGFLYHMVRNIVGTAIEVGSGKFTLQQFQTIFAGRDRCAAGITAPASGLYLQQVFY
jgi:tRNA pseudouridine38-40 synthase